MLTRNVTVDGFTAEDWTRVFEVLSPSPGDQRAPSSFGLVAVTTNNRLRKLVSTATGRLDPKAEPWPSSLEELAGRHDADWALSIHTGAFEELMDRFAARLRPEQDLLEQGLTLVSVLRELEREGAIQCWPWALGSWPVPTEKVAMRGLDLICPDGKSLALGVFENGDVYTAAVLRRGGTGFDRIVGPDGMRASMGLVSGDWTRDYRHLARAMEGQVGPLAMGLFAEAATLRRLVDDPAPGAWAAAVGARDVYLAPAAPSVAIPLGIDVGRAAFVAMRGVAERLGARDLFAPDGPLGPALDRASQATFGGRNLETVLGFDPVSLLRKLLFRSRRD